MIVVGTTIKLTANSLTIAKAVNGTEEFFTADAMDIAAAVTATVGCVALTQRTLATPIDLGTEVGVS